MKSKLSIMEMSKKKLQACEGKAVSLFIDEHGQLIFRDTANEVESPVSVTRCFPWMAPLQFISLRDEKSEELLLVRHVDELDSESRAALESVMDVVSFSLAIEEVYKIRSDYELRNWDVRTQCGKRSFQTKLEDWPRTLADGTILVEDVSGDLFYIPNFELLDRQSQKQLWSFLD